MQDPVVVATRRDLSIDSFSVIDLLFQQIGREGVSEEMQALVDMGDLGGVVYGQAASSLVRGRGAITVGRDAAIAG